jgi:hypothetical protein
MPREFNITGTCIPGKHYMVDISNKLNQIMKLVEKGQYFIINRPRQYGKTTTLFMLSGLLGQREDYVVFKLSFEGIDVPTYEKHERFIKAFLDILLDRLEIQGPKELSKVIGDSIENTKTMQDLSRLVTEFIKAAKKNVVLMIDEVDKSSNNQLFLDFLGMLRNKYLLRNEGADNTFHSVILAGVHDVKSLKLKIRPDEEQKYNSPWNIAGDFEVEMSFSPAEIATMLKDYMADKQVAMDIKNIAGKVYYYTSGYPFLVSKICKIIDEKIMDPAKLKWGPEDVDQAVKELVKESNTNFDSLIKNLENNPGLYKAVYNILIDGVLLNYNIHNPDINLGVLYGIFRNEDGLLKIHNRVYEQLIYDYLSSKVQTANGTGGYNFRENFIEEGGRLNFEKILAKFQEFMKEQYSERDRQFLEDNGRLLFLAFIKPIINSKGFDFKEVQVSEEKRLDVVVTYLDRKYVVELKIWRGPKAHENGIHQLRDYLERTGVDRGYLVVFDFRQTGSKDWKQEVVTVDGKEIFMVWV